MEIKKLNNTQLIMYALHRLLGEAIPEKREPGLITKIRLELTNRIGER